MGAPKANWPSNSSVVNPGAIFRCQIGGNYDRGCDQLQLGEWNWKSLCHCSQEVLAQDQFNTDSSQVHWIMRDTCIRVATFPMLQMLLYLFLIMSPKCLNLDLETPPTKKAGCLLAGQEEMVIAEGA